MVESLFQPFPMRPGRRAQAWRHRSEFRRPRHFHAEPELNIVLEGRALLGVGDALIDVRAGDVILFQPGQDHELVAAGPDLQLFVVAVRPEIAERACPTIARAAGRVDRLTSSRLARAAEILEDIDGISDASAVEAGLASLFAQVQRALSTNHVLSRRALEELGARPEIGGLALARHLGVDPSALSRRFRADLGVSFVTLRARQRTMSFIERVDAGSPLTQAAHEAGFGSYAQCHRVFSKALGCTPKRYFAGERSHIDDRCEAQS